MDARLVSACNRDPELLVRFRQDLYYRLNVPNRSATPSREGGRYSGSDQLRKFGDQVQRKLDGIEPEAFTALMNYHWPGNVRKLEHTIERAVLLGKRGRVRRTFRLRWSRARIMCRRSPTPLQDPTRSGLGKNISCVMEIVHGNKTEAAKTLGVDRTTLYRKLEEYKVKD